MNQTGDALNEYSKKHPYQEGIPMTIEGFNPQVSWFKRGTENLPESDVPVSDAIQAIKTGRFQREVQEIRSRFARALARTDGDREAAKKAVEGLKKRLPGATFSGIFGIRANKHLKNHSGLVCADLDYLGNKIEAVRSALVADEHLFGIFTSPTGDGLKALYRIPVCENEAQASGRV
jgi:hypothetical protein